MFWFSWDWYLLYWIALLGIGIVGVVGFVYALIRKPWNK